MNNRGNTGIVAVVLAALVGMTYLPRNAPENAAQSTQPTEIQSTPGAAETDSQPPSPCSGIGRVLKPFFDPYGVPYAPECPESIAGQTSELPTKNVLHHKFVIALVPHPLQTHLALEFDRAVEAIQQAAQDEGYAYDSSWFPWSDERRQYDRLRDDIAYRALKQQTEQQPGVMVFRKGLAQPPLIDKIKTDTSDHLNPYREGLVVFIVSEQPTHGVSEIQFENAMAWVSKLKAAGTGPLRILGPTASGTLPSLKVELQKMIGPWMPDSGIRIFSGTVSSPGSFGWFCTELEELTGSKKDEYAEEKPCAAWQSPEERKPAQEQSDHQEPSPPPRFEFRTYNESDRLKTERLLGYLCHEGYDVGHVAILSEDQTAFGGDPRIGVSVDCPNKSGNPIYLHYPRDIAALRTAYEKQSIFSAGRQAASTPATTLRGNLTEPDSSKSDTPRTYGGQLDSLALESLLFGIAGQLDQHDIKFVLIRSSNSLDQIFLSEFLRRTYPDARIVLDGADLLFLRSGQRGSPRGIMALTTYPLLPGQQQWTHTLRANHGGFYRVFGQDAAEGVYLAARGLIADAGDVPALVPVHDSLPPWWPPAKDQQVALSADQRRPPTWLTVVGHGRFWPVAALSDESTGSQGDKHAASLHTPASMTEIGEGDNPLHDDKEPGAHLKFPLAMNALLLLCIWFSIWHLYCSWYGSVRGRLQALTYFAPLPQPQQRQLIFIGSLMIGLMGAVLAVLSGLISAAELSSPWRVIMRVTTAVMVLCAAFSLIGNYSLPRVSAGPLPGKKIFEDKTLFGGFAKRFSDSWRFICWSVALLVLLVVGYAALLDWLLVWQLTLANKFPTFWRAIHLFSGVSPLLPQIILLLGLRAWFWCSIHGIALLGKDRPRLPMGKDLAVFPQDAEPDGTSRSLMRLFSREQAQAPVEEQAKPLGARWMWVLVILVPLSTLLYRLVLREWGVRSLGEKHFGQVVFWWLVLVTAMLLTDMVQTLRTWFSLRRVLVLLDQLRLRRTLAAMKGLAFGSVWKMGGNVLDDRHRLLARQFEGLGNLMSALQKPPCETEKDAVVRNAVLDRLTICMKKGQDFAEWYMQISDPPPYRPLAWDGISAQIGFTNKALSVVSWITQEWFARKVNPQLIGSVAPACSFQNELAETAGVVLSKVLVPEWRKESESLLVDKSRLQSGKAAQTDPRYPFARFAEVSDLVRAAEEFVVLPYLGFIQNTIGRIRVMALGMLALFLAMTLAVASYPFDPMPKLAGVFLGLFIAAGGAVAAVYGGMFRDATLSYVTDTTPGELGWQFWLKLAAFGIGPLLALMATWFPSMSDFLVSWLQPAAQTMK